MTIMNQVYNKYHKDAPSDAVSIMRPSKWGNPFVIGKDGDREAVIRRFETWLKTQDDLLASLDELRGRGLICCCAPQACHGHVLAIVLAMTPVELQGWRTS